MRADRGHRDGQLAGDLGPGQVRRQISQHPELAGAELFGFEQRLEYAAIGSVTNLASRLCDEAKANQIVVSRRVFGMVEQWADGRPLDDLVLKGFNHPVLAVEILGWHEEGEAAEVAAPAKTAAPAEPRRLKK